jgi:hypothetical protein
MIGETPLGAIGPFTQEWLNIVDAEAPTADDLRELFNKLRDTVTKNAPNVPLRFSDEQKRALDERRIPLADVDNYVRHITHTVYRDIKDCDIRDPEERASARRIDLNRARAALAMLTQIVNSAVQATLSHFYDADLLQQRPGYAPADPMQRDDSLERATARVMDALFPRVVPLLRLLYNVDTMRSFLDKRGLGILGLPPAQPPVQMYEDPAQPPAPAPLDIERRMADIRAERFHAWHDARERGDRRRRGRKDDDDDDIFA